MGGPFDTKEKRRQALAILDDPGKTDLEKLAAIGVVLLRQVIAEEAEEAKKR